MSTTPETRTPADATLEPPAADANRDPKTGRWLPGNRSAEQHGAVTVQRRGPEALMPEHQAELDTFMGGVLSDLGGAENITTLEKGLVQRLQETYMVLLACRADIAQRGMFTVRGRQRSSVATLAAYIDRFQRLAAQLGLKRRPKDVGETVQTWIARYNARRITKVGNDDQTTKQD